MLDLEKKIAYFGNDYSKHSYSFFSTLSGRNFVFISENPINFTEYEKLTPKLASFASLEKGLLYDIDNDIFVYSNNVNYTCVETWPTFLIYDHSIPHVIVHNYGHNTLYSILYWEPKRRNFSCITSISKPQFISHVGVNSVSNDVSIINKSHIIFVHSPARRPFRKSPKQTNNTSISETTNMMLVLDDELNVTYIDSGVEFHSVHHFKSRLDSNQKAYNSLYSVARKFEISQDEDYFCADFIFHTFDGDAVIIKTNKSELGEYVFVLLKGEITIDYSMGFFKYSKFEETEDFKRFEHVKAFFDNNPFLIFHCRRNDFENISYGFNLKTHKIFNYDFLIDLWEKRFLEIPKA